MKLRSKFLQYLKMTSYNGAKVLIPLQFSWSRRVIGHSDFILIFEHYVPSLLRTIFYIEDLFDELNDSTIFSKLDLCSEYHQIQMATKDALKIVFWTHEKHYVFLLMLFGSSNAIINEIFRPLLRRNVLVFWDNILVFNLGLTTHEQHLRNVLKILQRH